MTTAEVAQQKEAHELRSRLPQFAAINPEALQRAYLELKIMAKLNNEQATHPMMLNMLRLLHPHIQDHFPKSTETIKEWLFSIQEQKQLVSTSF